MAWKEMYRDYLESPEWKMKSQLVRERSGGGCERCHLGHDQAHVHHKSYKGVKYDRGEHRIAGTESLDDLLGVCAPCHRYLHSMSKVDPASFGEDWVSFGMAMLAEL